MEVPVDQRSNPTQREFKVYLPMRIQSSKKKKTAMNLNVYRNLHFRSLTAQKKNFAKIAKELLRGMPQLGRIRLHYDICPSTKRRLDIVNVGSIVDKYFSDSLTENEIIEDDNYLYLDHVSFGFGGIVKEEYVLVTITEIEKKDNIMKVLLDNNDLQIACNNYVETLGIAGASGVKLSVGDNGEIEAEVLFGIVETTPPTPAPAKPKSKGGRPAGSKNKVKPKEEPDGPVEAADPISGDSGNGARSKTPETETPSTVTKDDDTPTPKASTGGKKSKNLFEESPEESSKTDDTPTTPETGGSDEASPTPVKKKSSIFDSDDD